MLELLRRYAFTHALLSNFAYFSIVATLVLALKSHGVAPEAIAFSAIGFTWAYRGGRVVLAPLLDRSSISVTLVTGCLCAAVSLVVAATATGPSVVVAAVMGFGIGMSVNALATKQLVARVSDTLVERERVFSIYNVVVNAAATLAPLLAILLLETGGTRALWLLLAVFYAAIGLAAGGVFRRDARPASATAVPAYRRLLGIAQVRRLLVLNAFGWFFCGLLVSVIPLYASALSDGSGAFKWLLVLNAALIVLLQVPFTLLLERSPTMIRSRVIPLSLTVFAAAFLVLAAWGTQSGLVLFVIVFTTAEMLFLPSLESQFAGAVPGDARASAYSLLALSCAAGESAGAFLAITGYTALGQGASVAALWLGFVVLAVAFSAAALRLGQRAMTGAPT